jgi:DNA-binding transcriptional LysR family regulator
MRKINMNRFAEMATFVEVIEAGSLSAAASHLGIAVSAVSRRIRELETRLGVTLANRSTRGMSTTPLGQAYYERCVLLLSEVENTDALISKDATYLCGRTRFSIPQEFGNRFLSPILIAFSNNHPEVILDIDVSDRSVDMISEGFDFAVRIGREQSVKSNSIKIGEISYSIAASPSFWCSNGLPKAPQDLSGMPLLAYRAAMYHGKLFYDNDQYVQLKPRLLSNNGVCLIKAAVAGLGICFEPKFMLEEALNLGELESVFSDKVWLKRDVYAIYPKGKALPILAQRLLDKIVVSLEQHGIF